MLCRAKTQNTSELVSLNFTVAALGWSAMRKTVIVAPFGSGIADSSSQAVVGLLIPKPGDGKRRLPRQNIPLD
jgi:hypothetical protein